MVATISSNGMTQKLLNSLNQLWKSVPALRGGTESGSPGNPALGSFLQPMVAATLYSTNSNNAAATTTTVTVPNALPGVTTTIAAGSNGATLPQATINVAATGGFAATSALGGLLTVLTAAGPQLVSYTGTTATTFTGCAGGVGAMATGGFVAQGADTVIVTLLQANKTTAFINHANGYVSAANTVVIWPFNANGVAITPGSADGVWNVEVQRNVSLVAPTHKENPGA